MKCKFTKDDGKQCGNYHLRNDEYCYWHSGAIPESEKIASRIRGGKERIIKSNGKYKHTALKTIEEAMKLNALLINNILSNDLDLRVATGIGQLLGLQLKLIETSDLEKRLKKVEAVIEVSEIEGGA